MISFIRYFILEWYNFPGFRWFCESRGIDWKENYKNRLDYSWKLAKIRNAHRDRYSRKCTGECEQCKAKHC